MNSTSYTPVNYGLIGQGAITWASGTSGFSGVVVNETNSLIGTNSTNGPGSTVTALPNGNYVVLSPWAASGTVGAVTFGNGLGGGPVGRYPAATA